MRKIATSIGLMAALCLTAVRAGHDQIQGTHIPVLQGHLSDGGRSGPFVSQGLGAHNDGALGRLGEHLAGNDTAKDHPTGECLSHRIRHHDDCGCEHNDWGCDAASNPQRHAGIESFQGVEESLTATLIPAQILQTNQTTVTNGTKCEQSAGQRRKNESECFALEGNFNVAKFDCQEQCESFASCFQQNGKGSAIFCDHEGQHDIDACDCNAISSEDLLDLDSDCDCLQFERDDHREHDMTDPEADVDRRINKQIEKTIADILSEIVQNAFHQALEDVIEFD